MTCNDRGTIQPLCAESANLSADRFSSRDSSEVSVMVWSVYVHVWNVHAQAHLALYSFANGQISASLKLMYRALYLALLCSGDSHPDIALCYVSLRLSVFVCHCCCYFVWGTGIRGLMRGMATLPQGNQELLVVRDKVGRPPGELGVSKSLECDIFPSVLWRCWLGDRKGIRPVK